MDHPQHDTVAIAPAVSRLLGAAIIAPTQNIFVAFQCLDGQTYLTSTPFASTFTASIPENADIVQHLRAVNHRMTVDDKHEPWLSQRFTKTIVGTAELQQVCPHAVPHNAIIPFLRPQSSHATDTEPQDPPTKLRRKMFLPPRLPLQLLLPLDAQQSRYHPSQTAAHSHCLQCPT